MCDATAAAASSTLLLLLLRLLRLLHSTKCAPTAAQTMGFSLYL
jgi:hypothetical protein